MKKLLFLFFISIGCLAYAQPYELPLYFEDTQGRKDTVLIGVNIPNATSTIDPSLGEINLLSTPWDSLDARVIRSTSNDTYFHGIFQEVDSVDQQLKVDYRTINLDYSLWFFEIEFKAYDYPVLIKSEISEDLSHYGLNNGSYFMIDQSQPAVPGSYPSQKMFYSVSDTVYNVTDTNHNKLLVQFGYLIGINENQNQSSLNIYPNPSNGLVNINSDKIIDHIEFTTLDGRICKREFVYDLTYSTYLSLVSGAYLVKVLYEDGLFETKRLIIE